MLSESEYKVQGPGDYLRIIMEEEPGLENVDLVRFLCFVLLEIGSSYVTQAVLEPAI